MPETTEGRRLKCLAGDGCVPFGSVKAPEDFAWGSSKVFPQLFIGVFLRPNGRSRGDMVLGNGVQDHVVIKKPAFGVIM